MNHIPRTRVPGTHVRHPRLTAHFDLRCACGANDWVLLRSKAAPDEEGRERSYGCCACGARMTTREVEAYPVMAAEPLYCRATPPTPDTPCPRCAHPRLRRCTYAAYDALLAHVYTCLRCRAEWSTAELMHGGIRRVLPRESRRGARRAAGGGGP